MTWVILGIISILLFVIGVVSPHAAGKVQRKTDKKATYLKKISNWLWDPLTWWAQTIVDTSRKIILKSTEWGKKTRRKLPF